MGIRYYAHAVLPHNVQAEQELLDGYYQRAPLMQRLSLENPDHDCDLDKAWSRLQRLLEPQDDEPPRAAYRLFEGQVIMANEGEHWPYMRVVGPAEVVTGAADLATVTRFDVRAAVHTGRIRPDDEDEVAHFLGRAQRYFARAAENGWAVSYTIA
ncbi:DUF1877 family protein [Luteipulveratus sp. YIM 133132]|uniref:DUF1877 family protein n=1 Tax=Luteipulveratus flavus TaxID=3031728 RepID=A0ABT6C608_9MICO|nr:MULTISPECIES: DUF1877 family protein [unclassified Luteipulveratus]MDE9364104.1 DUF1877 family protein [Luteipulveratus sp. YIM 133132]MDF8264322.1 DUF1877 family protein [Luteipulveratus sp. YIM 133296]